MKKLAEIVRNSGKNERLDEPKTRKGGSCKNEIEMKRQVTVSVSHDSLGAPQQSKDPDSKRHLSEDSSSEYL